MSFKDGGDRVLVKCHAGCDTKNVALALGLSLAELFTPDDRVSLADLCARKKLDPDFLTKLGVRELDGKLAFPYRNADGTVARERLRDSLKAGKGFKWAAGSGSYPYGREQLVNARKAGFLFIVEGESDTWSAWQQGIPCLGLPGATSFGVISKEDLAGIPKVYAVREPDTAGGKFIDGILLRVRDLEARCVVYEVTLPVKDLSELHIQDPEAFKASLKIAMDAARALPSANVATVGRNGLTDLGNAERLIAQHGTHILYDVSRKSWRVYNGKAWILDDRFAVYRLQRESLLDLYREAAEAEKKDEREEIAEWARKSEATRALSAALEQARTLPGVQVGREDLDADTMLLNVDNGSIDLRTGTLRSHNPRDLLSRMAPVVYDPLATCPLFLNFLEQIYDSDASIIEFMRRFLGYACTGDTSEQVMLMWYGDGANGKSTLLRILRSVLGNDPLGYSLQTEFSTFVEQRTEKIRTDIARMDGARLVCAAEVRDLANLDEAILKQLTGQERLTARFLYSEEFEFFPRLKLLLIANRLPKIRGCDHAIWRRIRLVPHPIIIPPEARNPRLAEELIEKESSGILAWLVSGSRDWFADSCARRDGLATPASVVAATAEYRNAEDSIGGFLTDCCDVAHGKSELAGRLYQSYLAWCERSAEHKISPTMFGRRLLEHHFEKSKTTSGTRSWDGVALKPGCEAVREHDWHKD